MFLKIYFRCRYFINTNNVNRKQIRDVSALSDVNEYTVHFESQFPKELFQ